jgi:hypothetical protein
MIGVAIGGCTGRGREVATEKVQPSECVDVETTQELAGVQDRPFSREILEAARGYRSLELVSTQHRLAPKMCRAMDSVLVKSRAGEGSEHGEKLYLMWANDASTYFDSPDVKAMRGQTLVKQSFEAVETLRTFDPTGETYKTFDPGESREYFVMFRTNPKDLRTDDGWVYGIVDAALTRTIDSGRIASCMGCHTKRETRMFGMRELAQPTVEFETK